jgi:hypothetical protein
VKSFILTPVVGLAGAASAFLVTDGLLGFGVKPVYAAACAIGYVIGCAGVCIVQAIKDTRVEPLHK